MKKKLLILLILNLSFPNNNIRLNSLLFCIKNTEQINLINSNTTSNEDLNVLIKSINSAIISLWLPGATNKDIDDNINLSKIYRLTFLQKPYDEIEKIRYVINSSLDCDINLFINRVEKIDRSKSGKLKQFYSELT